MMFTLPPATTALTFSRTVLASPTVRRPFKARMTIPSRSVSVISKLMDDLLVYRSGGGLGSGGLNRLRPHGQQHREASAFPDGAGHVNPAAMHFHNPRDEAQPQAQSLHQIGFRIPHPVEAIENMRQILGRD